MQIGLIEVERTELCSASWQRIANRSDIQREGDTFQRVKIVDLFSGCGGMTLGASEALRHNGLTFKISLAVDSNAAALGVYRRNFDVSSQDLYCGDINEIVSVRQRGRSGRKQASLKDRFKNLDILLAGPPCQGHSNLNNHTRRQDPRNELYLNVVNFAKLTRPKVAIIENVSAIVHDEFGTIAVSNRELEKAGYNVYNIIVNTADFGVAQVRKRHLQLCVLKEHKVEIDLDEYKVSHHTPISDVISDLRNKRSSNASLFDTPSSSNASNQARIKYLFENDQYDLPDDMRPACHKEKAHSYRSCYGRMYWNKPAQTITSGFGSIGQGRFIHPKDPRVITPHEAARIQGFPDFFKFDEVSSRTELHTMIANAVPPKIIAIIIDCLIKQGIFDQNEK